MVLVLAIFIGWTINSIEMYVHGVTYTWQLWLFWTPLVIVISLVLIGVVGVIFEYREEREENVEKEKLLTEIAFWNGVTYNEAALKFKEHNLLNLRNEISKLKKD